MCEDEIQTAALQYGSNCCDSSCSVNSTSPNFPDQVTGITYTYTAGVFGWEGWIHKVKLEGLSTNFTQYCYRVGQTDADNWSDIFQFHTKRPSPTNEPTRMAVYGDMGTIIPFGWLVTDQMVSDSALDGPFDMFMHAGDLAYAGTSKYND